MCVPGGGGGGGGGTCKNRRNYKSPKVSVNRTRE